MYYNDFAQKWSVDYYLTRFESYNNTYNYKKKYLNFKLKNLIKLKINKKINILYKKNRKITSVKKGKFIKYSTNKKLKKKINRT